MPLASPAQSPPAKIWVRRPNADDGLFAVRFEVTSGKGMLRIERPGVLIDPPARPTGIEERLTAKQVLKAKFVVVFDDGRARQVHLFERLVGPDLEHLEMERWHEIVVGTDGVLRYADLVVPAEPPSAMITPSPSPRFVLLPLPDGDGSVASGWMPPEPLVPAGPEARLRRALAAAIPVPVALLEDEEAEEMLALGEAGDSEEDAQDLSLAVPEEPESTPLALEAAFDPPSEPAPLLGAASFYASFDHDFEEAVFSIDLPSHRVSTEHVTVRSGGYDEGGAFAREELPPLPEIEPVRASPPVEPAPATVPEPEEVARLGHRSRTTLVRFMRRTGEQQRARVLELEHRVAELEAMLAERPPHG